MKNPDCTVLVCSCDRYCDLWRPFAALWKKYWPDCPFETVLVTESQFESGQVDDKVFDRTIACGDNTNWASRLVKVLSQTETPFGKLQNALNLGWKEKR